MLRPIGKKYSANYYQVALENWARINSINIGSIGWIGFNFGVECGDTKQMCQFIIEGRGSKNHTPKCKFSFIIGRHYIQTKRQAFKLAKLAFLEIQKGQPQ